MPPKAVTSQHKGRVKGTQTAGQKGSETMVKYCVVLLERHEIVVLRGETIIAESCCGSLYPTLDAKDEDFEELIDIADYYNLFYIEREDNND